MFVKCHEKEFKTKIFNVTSYQHLLSVSREVQKHACSRSLNETTTAIRTIQPQPSSGRNNRYSVLYIVIDNQRQQVVKKE
jgi:hypothetical protein